jgi:hypothetical protein
MTIPAGAACVPAGIANCTNTGEPLNSASEAGQLMCSSRKQ